MATRVESFTHKGWFGICPVYVGDLETDCPNVTPRWENWVTTALFLVSHYSFMAFFTVADIVNPDWQPGFPLLITEELLVKHLYEYEDDE